MAEKLTAKELLALLKARSDEDIKNSKFITEFNKRLEERQKIFERNWKKQQPTEEFLNRRYTI